eukprot:6181010-Pleurochrysis_carterae.AAC.1
MMCLFCGIARMHACASHVYAHAHIAHVLKARWAPARKQIWALARAHRRSHAHMRDLMRKLRARTHAHIARSNEHICASKLAGALASALARLVGVPLVWRYYKYKDKQKSITQFKHSLANGPTRDQSEWGPREYVHEEHNNPSTGAIETVRVSLPLSTVHID